MDKIVFSLLIIINLLNLIFSRDGSDGDRVVIQACNGLLLIVVLFQILLHLKKNETNVVKFLLVLIGLLLLYLFAQYAFIHNAFFSLGNYVKWLLSMSLIVYFCHSKSHNVVFLLQLYTITYITQIAKKIFSGHWFQNAVGGGSEFAGGDFASLGLAMVVPLIFIAFDKKKAPLLFFICFALTVFSLRRSSIIAISVALPFFWPYIKKYFNKKNIVWFSAVLVSAFVYVWHRIGFAVFARMQQLFQTQYAHGSTSYGSGRSVYWLSLLDNFRESGNWFLGNGVGSVYEHYCTRFLYVHLSHAHSDLFEILYTFGAIGLLAWLGFCVSFIKEVRKNTLMPSRRMGYGIIFLYLFVALTTGIIYRAEFFPMGIAMGLFLKLSQQKNHFTVSGV